MYYELGTQNCLSKAKEESSKRKRCASAASPCAVPFLGDWPGVALATVWAAVVAWDPLRGACAPGAQGRHVTGLRLGSAGLTGLRPV